MAEGVVYFFDSYAAIELVEGNPLYSIFADEPVTLTIFNVAEIYYYALNNLSPRDAETTFSRFHDCVVEVDDETLKAAVKFRKKYKKRDLSYTDAIGYIYAKRHGMKFLTGDKEFEALPNVEFVKRAAA